MNHKVTLETLKKLETEMGFEGQLIARGYYKSLWDQICNKKDWKGPINRDFNLDLMADLDDAGLDTIRYAVVYFTGNPDCTVTYQNQKGVKVVHIKTAGYRAGPCGG